jgi:hypothetical protein
MEMERFDESKDFEIKNEMNFAVSRGRVRVEDAVVTRFVNHELMKRSKEKEEADAWESPNISSQDKRGELNA